MSRTRLALLFAVAIAIACAAGVAGADDAGGRPITDMTGRTVRLPEHVTRVAGTGGAVDAWVLLLGSPEKLVATSDSIKANPWFVKIYPRILDVPSAFSAGDINIESLIAQNPQAVILLSGMAAISKIENSGIPTVVLERRDPAELEQAVDIAARVLGPEEEQVAARFRAYYDTNIKLVTERTASLPPGRRPRVFFASGSALTTEGRNTLVTSWIDLAGGRNMAAEAGVVGMGRKVSLEAVVAWDPEIIIAMNPGVRDEILHGDQWKHVSAVANNRVYVNPKSVYSWSVRSADEALQVLWAAKAIQPELFTDLDIVAETRRFHRLFYKIELSDGDVARILAAEPPQ